MPEGSRRVRKRHCGNFGGQATLALTCRVRAGCVLPRNKRAAIGELKTVEVRAYIPSKDFALCKQFYQDFGVEPCLVIGWFGLLSERVSSFLRQKFYNKEHADNFMKRLLVEDVDDRWRHVQALGIVSRYDVRAEPPANRPWDSAFS
jgi:hypothetical protein